MTSLRPALDHIQKAHSIGILSHIRPDGDAYGSMLGLGLALEILDKKVFFWNEDGLASLYKFLPQSQRIQKTPVQPPEVDLLISVDTSTYDRLGSLFLGWNRGIDINIDHHVSNTEYGKINVIRPELPAAAALIVELIETAGWKMTPDIASALFVGISTDTGSFRYRGTTADTFRAAAKLAEEGADVATLARYCYQSLSPERFILKQMAMQHISLEIDNQLAYLEIDPSMYERSGARSEDSEGLVEMLQEIETVKISALFDLQPRGLLKVSLRSKEINVGKVAQEFGGGGHKLAAGIRLSDHSKKELVLARLRKSLNAS